MALAQGNSLAASVRLFAQLNVALADTAIAAWNTKFAYNLWRPIDAIRKADIDNNAGTTQDADWAPLLIMPPHPEYISGHFSFSAAAATVLKSVFGDGVIHTSDDLFLTPIAHAKVYVLGQEDRFVLTDASGDLTLDDLPAGTIKVAIDGRTATDAPSGVFWPEMVMDVELRPGVDITVMDRMGSEEERLANAGRTEVYLPRVPTTILSLVDNNAPTTVGVDAEAGPDLTETQRNALTLTVDPGSVIGEDGQMPTNAEIGISAMPPNLVCDMLPAGVLQHTFDITIQAPGAATFTTPARISFPNGFNAPPGSKLNMLSFDRTTGMQVINGTATLSEDGLSVVFDDGSGVRAPGWHGVIPPGGCGDGGTPPPPADPPGRKQLFITATISVEGDLSKYMKAGAKNDVALGGMKTIEENPLYGRQLIVTVVNGKPDGSTDTVRTTYYM